MIAEEKTKRLLERRGERPITLRVNYQCRIDQTRVHRVALKTHDVLNAVPRFVASTCLVLHYTSCPVLVTWAPNAITSLIWTLSRTRLNLRLLFPCSRFLVVNLTSTMTAVRESLKRPETLQPQARKCGMFSNQGLHLC